MNSCKALKTKIFTPIIHGNEKGQKIKYKLGKEIPSIKPRCLINANNNSNSQKFYEVITKIKNQIISKGNKSIFNMQKILLKFSEDINESLITFDDLCNLFEVLEINITGEEVELIFDELNGRKIGYINYDSLIKNIIGCSLNRRRQNIITNLYYSLNNDNNHNFIYIEDLKRIFNPGGYNYIFGENKNNEFIYYDYIDNLDIFINYINKLRGENLNTLNYEEFLRYFEQVSMYFMNDEFFEDYIKSCWYINIR